MGLQSLNDRLQDPDCSLWFHGIFPKDTPRNMRFSINFFTSIGLGGLTDKMRAYLKVSIAAALMSLSQIKRAAFWVLLDQTIIIKTR